MNPPTSPIAEFTAGSLSLRGIPIDEVQTKFSFIEGIVLMLTGQAPLPCDPRVNVLNLLLNSWLDHGDKPPMTQNAINCASVGVPFSAAVMAALCTWGVDHCPIDAAAKLFSKLVEAEGDVLGLAHVLTRYSVFPGFGHPVHDKDPRTAQPLLLATQLELAGRHCAALGFVETHLSQKGIRANLGGVTAALWLDMGLPIESVSLVPLLGRAVGLAAHYTEQRRHGAKFAGTPPKH